MVSFGVGGQVGELAAEARFCEFSLRCMTLDPGKCFVGLQNESKSKQRSIFEYRKVLSCSLGAEKK